MRKRKKRRYLLHSGAKAAQWRKEGWYDLGSCQWGKLYAGEKSDVIVVRDFNTLRITGTRILEEGLLAMMEPHHARKTIMALKKPGIGDDGKRPAGPKKPAKFGVDYPVLSDYLFESSWEDGTPRQTATMTIMAGPSTGFKAVLNDRAMKRSLWVLADSTDDLFASLELLLADEETPWVADVVRKEFWKK
jgi:hypothetical protein